MPDTGTWDASSLDLISTQVVQHIWKVEFPRLTNNSVVPAWDISVSLDGGRSPYGTATFKAPVSYMAEVADGSGTFFTKLNPYYLPCVRIWAGWRHAINGVQTDDLQILFTGFISSRELVLEEGKGYVQFTAESTETKYDYPLHRTWAWADTYTTVKQVCDSSWANSNPWYRSATIVEESGYMNTPTSTQITAGQALQAQIGDNVGDFIRSMANTLGQWARGNIRSANNSPEWLISGDPYPYRSYFTLPSGVFTEIHRKDGLEDWANLLEFTAQWTDSSSGELKTKKGWYAGNGVTGAANTGSTLAVRGKSVTALFKPPSGALPTTYAPALAWLRRIQDMSEVFYTATGRAVWWLQPRIHGLQVSGLGLADVPGPISSINFLVDQGTMSVAWNTNNTRT